jgi:hypothetical protein
MAGSMFNHQAFTVPGEAQQHFGRGPVEISLISAVRTHALCVHTQECFGRRHRRASRRGPAAHRPHLVAHTLHTHAYAGLIRPREKHPRNSDLRHQSARTRWSQRCACAKERDEPDELVAGVHDLRLRATSPTLLLVTALALCSRLAVALPSACRDPLVSRETPSRCEVSAGRRHPTRGSTSKERPSRERRTSKCRWSRLAIARVRYRSANTTIDASATPIAWSR